MKLASYSVADATTYGLLSADGTGLIDLKARFPEAPTLKALMSAPDWQSKLEKLDEAAEHRLEDVRFLPVIPDPDKILCIGINYAGHVKETGREMPDKPMVFVRFANSQIGHCQPMLRPKVSERFDFEGELAIVIGRTARYVSPEEALACIAGYSCYNDGSVRDWQRHTTQFTPGKNFPATGAFGPWLVTRDEVGEIGPQRIVTRLNGDVVQQATFEDLIFGVQELVSYCSAFTLLQPGDVIITGTPAGVGAFRTPPKWLKEGDTVEVEIDCVGVLRNTVVDEHI
ncbi:fumarylacetoacetate hydrolase family protein [Mesorhizobium sp. 1B3]|uniref:fumarylacetoacetate hydrolase family protein n=1 Tax=Mesorhizobium sp. 1B3 TaxID=3243599 RepID=UPI003D983CB1